MLQQLPRLNVGNSLYLPQHEIMTEQQQYQLPATAEHQGASEPQLAETQPGPW
jgi:hypothetical protein